MSNRKYCSLDGCRRPAHYKESGLCKTCYARMYYQIKKGVSWAFKRTKQLSVWQAGLEQVMGNVEIIDSGRRGRKRRAA